MRYASGGGWRRSVSGIVLVSSLGFARYSFGKRRTGTPSATGLVMAAQPVARIGNASATNRASLESHNNMDANVLANVPITCLLLGAGFPRLPPARQPEQDTA